MRWSFSIRVGKGKSGGLGKDGEFGGSIGKVGWALAGRGLGAQGLGSSLLGACLRASSRARVVANLSPKLQSHSHIAVIHAQHSHLVLGGALSTPQGICPGLETWHVTQQDPQGSPGIPEPGIPAPSPRSQAKGGAHLVVVSQMHCVPLPITEAPWNHGADHCVGLTCGADVHGGWSGAARPPLPLPSHASTATPRVTLDASDNVPLLVATLARPECLWTRGRSTAFMEKVVCWAWVELHVQEGLGGSHPPQPTSPHMHPLAPTLTHGAGAPTGGICEPHLPSHELQGQEVVLLVQASVVEEQPTGLHRGEPGVGEGPVTSKTPSSHPPSL